MSTATVEKHGICSQHGLLDASDCGVCRNLRLQCGLEPTEDHTTCGKADLKQTIRISQDEYDEFVKWRSARIDAQRKAGLTV
jgi:hypothetical protein